MENKITHISFEPKGVCSQNMDIQVSDGVVSALHIRGGCSGNLQGISRLVEGMPVEEVIRRLNGIRCGDKPTSCPDQLAQVLRQMIDQQG